MDAQTAIKAIELMRNPEGSGKFSFKPIRLLPAQKDFLTDLLALDATGNPLVREAMLWQAKKGGKTTLFAALAALFLFHEQHGQIICAATAKDQAAILFKKTKSIIEQDAWMSARCRLYRREIYSKYSHSELRCVSSDSYNINGIEASKFFYDEIGFVDDNGELYNAVTSSMVNRDFPLTLGISTAGESTTSFGYQKFEETKRAIENPTLNPHFLGRIYQGDPARWWDIEEWYRASPSLREIGNKENILAKIEAAKQNPSQVNGIIRYHTNNWISSVSDDSPISIEAWDASNDSAITIESLAGKECDIGIDLASRSDQTAVSAWFPLDDSRFAVRVWYFTPQATLNARELRDKAPYSKWVDDGWMTTVEGNIMDSGPVFSLIQELRGIYSIRDVGIDQNHNATDLAVNLMNDGFNVQWVGQGWKTMTPTFQEMERLILSRRLIHFGNPVLRWNAQNLRLRFDDNDNPIPTKRKSRGRIDGFIASLDAMYREMSRRQGGGFSFSVK